MNSIIGLFRVNNIVANLDTICDAFGLCPGHFDGAPGGGAGGSCARRWRADFLGICNRGFLAFLPLEVIFRLGFVFALITSLSLA